MNIFTVHLLTYRNRINKRFLKHPASKKKKRSHVDRRPAYIEWRHWVSGTLPTVLIVDSLVLFPFFSSLFSKKLWLTKVISWNALQWIRESNAGACEVDFHWKARNKKPEYPKSLNEPQKHHWAQWSVIIYNKSTTDRKSKYSPMISLVVFQTMKK